MLQQLMTLSCSISGKGSFSIGTAHVPPELEAEGHTPGQIAAFFSCCWGCQLAAEETDSVLVLLELFLQINECRRRRLALDPGPYLN